MSIMGMVLQDMSDTKGSVSKVRELPLESCLNRLLKQQIMIVR